MEDGEVEKKQIIYTVVIVAGLILFLIMQDHLPSEIIESRYGSKPAVTQEQK